MSGVIIVLRNPSNKLLTTISDDEGNPMEFPTKAAAEKLAGTHPLCRAWNYQIVRLSV